jgi:hypothetical protein
MRGPALAPGRTAVLVAALVGAAAPSDRLRAQERLLDPRSAAVGVGYELWRFDDGLTQPSLRGEAIPVRRVSLLSVPVTALVPIGSRVTVDVGGGWASGEVTLDGADEAGRTAWSIAGPTDTKVRVATRFLEDQVLVTLGANLPTGKLDLDEEEYEAARVLVAPALGLAMPVLGNGASYTAGVVAARQLGGASVALGASYERRTSYSPVGGLVAGLPSLRYQPGHAARVSLMANGLVRGGEMRAGLSVDAFGSGRSGSTDTDEGAPIPHDFRLGPVFTGEWHWRLPTRRFRALQLSVVDRFRMRYEEDGEAVAGSDANYLDVAVEGVLPAGARTDVVLGLSGRHHTGLDSDDTIVAAAFAGGGLSFGLAHRFGGGYAVQPMVRAQLGRIETAGRSSGAGSLGGAVVLSRTF